MVVQRNTGGMAGVLLVNPVIKASPFVDYNRVGYSVGIAA
jgi:hypothetical protein